MNPFYQKLARAIFATPASLAVFYLVYPYLTVDGKPYWYEGFLLMSFSFFAASFIIAFVGKAGEAKLIWYWLRIFFSAIAGWIFAVAVTAIYNLTPACVGQNNGDGINDLRSCVAISVLTFVWYLPVIVVVSAVSALIGAFLSKKI